MKAEMNPTVEGNGQISPLSDEHWPKKSNHSAVIDGDISEQLSSPVTDKYVSMDHDDPAARDDTEQLEALIGCLQEDFGDIKRRTYELFRKNKTAYDLLWCLFPIGSEVVFKDPSSGVNCAGKVRTFSLC